VLVDTEPIINRADAQMLTACGYSIRQEALIERFWRISDAETRNIIEQEWAACYAARVGEMVESGFRQSLAPMDGVTELLARAQIQSPDSAHLPENRRTGGV
jgi:beta-phosphoglucomutase-like phosphatase (HAD superfamily)